MDPFWPDPITRGVDTVIRIVSWNLRGEETTLFDLTYAVAQYWG
jgi:hypothetical protein